MGLKPHLMLSWYTARSPSTMRPRISVTSNHPSSRTDSAVLETAVRAASEKDFCDVPTTSMSL